VLQKKIYIPTIPHKIFEANLKSSYPSVSVVVVVEALIVNANTSSTTLTTLSGGRGLLMLMV